MAEKGEDISEVIPEKIKHTFLKPFSLLIFFQIFTGSDVQRIPNFVFLLPNWIVLTKTRARNKQTRLVRIEEIIQKVALGKDFVPVPCFRIKFDKNWLKIYRIFHIGSQAAVAFKSTMVKYIPNSKHN